VFPDHIVGKKIHGHSNDKASFFAFGHSSLISHFCVMTPEARAEYLQEHPTCCAVAAERDPVNLQIAVDKLVAKRARKQECETCPEKLKAAIKKTMAKRQERKVSQSQSSNRFASGCGTTFTSPKGKGKGRRAGDSSNDDSDDSDGSNSSS